MAYCNNCNKWLERSDCERSRRNDQMAYKKSQSMIPWRKKDRDSLGIKRGCGPPLKMLTTIEFRNLGEDWLGATYLGHLWAFLSNNPTCYHLQLSSWGVDDVVQMNWHVATRLPFVLIALARIACLYVGQPGEDVAASGALRFRPIWSSVFLNSSIMVIITCGKQLRNYWLGTLKFPL